MFNRKKLAAFAASAAVALSLVGVGTSAQFSDAVTAQQDVRTGTAQLAITSAPGGVISPDAKSVTYTLDNVGSTFWAYHYISVTNVGTLPMHGVNMSLSAQGNSELTDNVYAFILDGPAAYPPWSAYGMVSDLVSRPQPLVQADYTLATAADPAHNTGWYNFALDAYNLPNAAQGKAMSVTLTINAIEGIGTEPWYGEGLLASSTAKPTTEQEVRQFIADLRANN
jgi:predicted ribosomally synthesized peptide with SipW-like signal peptide